MKTTIIMPCIRVPQNVEAWTKQLHAEDGDEVIIVGNEKSPHSDIAVRLDEMEARYGIPMTYLAPWDERVMNRAIEQFTPANHTTRRNFALLEAIRRDTDLLLTLDDDNFPYKDTFLDGVKALTDPTIFHHRPVIKSATGWWNAGRLCRPSVIHRGWPISRWRDVDQGVIADGLNPRIGVVASLWLGDPDISALQRITYDPLVKDVPSSAVLDTGTWCPFDSQSTTVVKDLIPLMFMWPGVGRYDDIWSSYAMRAVMDMTHWYVTYGAPLVTQERNPHNLLRDLEDELYGYKHTEELTDDLRNLVLEYSGDTSNAYAVYHWLTTELAKRSLVIPSLTRDAMLAWLIDVHDVLTEY